MKKTIWIILGAFAIAAIFAAGGFYGGMTYAKNQATQIQAQFFRERGGNPPTGGFPGGGVPGANGTAMPGGAQGFFGGITTGEITSMDGNTLTVTTARGEATITMTGTTTVEKSQPGAASDLQTGQQVLITGQRDANGNVAAAQVLILTTSLMQSAPGATP
jgi:hypothetical protein